MEQGDDPYRILKVSKKASDGEIKTAYRKLALKEHPDRKTNPQEREAAVDIFAKISNSYELLSDPEKRREYDILQIEQEKKSGTTNGFDKRKVDVEFNSPYEVFKRDFEETMGFEYPGAKYDFNDKTLENGDHNTSKTNRRGSTGNLPSNRSSFNNKSNGAQRNNNDCTTLVKREDANNRNHNSDSRALVTRDNQNQNNRNKNNSRNNRSDNNNNRNESNGVEGDNRPTLMEPTEKKITHPDGTVETITETKMHRPDGSIETVCVSDCANKRPDWKQRVNQPKNNKGEPKRLSNG